MQYYTTHVKLYKQSKQVNKQLTYTSESIFLGKNSLLSMFLKEFSTSWLVGEMLFSIPSPVTEKQIKTAAESTCYDAECQDDKW